MSSDRIAALEKDLEAKGFDGLYCTAAECACEIGALATCGALAGDVSLDECKPGYLDATPPAWVGYGVHIRAAKEVNKNE